MQAQSQQRITRVLGSAIALTGIAEVAYFFMWGMMLFPDGNLAGKAIWTATCGIAMGAVIGGATLLLVEGRFTAMAAMLAAAAIVAVVGSYCAWLCSRIDARFDYFGGEENGTLFILSGVIPAILGGLLYGWWVYGGKGSSHAS